MTETAQPIKALNLVSAELLRQLIEQAAVSPRRRSHLLLHGGPDDQVQRLVIAAQLDTYVRPHHHSRQWEMLVLQRGCIDVLTFDGDGKIRERRTLDRTSPIVQIPISEWHTCVVREPDTVVVEIKPGPYRPNEFAEWAPEEGSDRVALFMQWANSASAGQKWRPY